MLKKFLSTIIIVISVFFASAQNQNISNGNIFEGEPFVAVNPTNSQNIVIAWMGFVLGNGTRLSIKVKSSFNGGTSWNNTLIIPHVIPTYKSADPSMAFDENGNLFLCFIDYRENPDSGGVYLCKSIDGGLTWGSPILALDAYADGTKIPVDRPWLAINNAGDKMYITTKPAPWIPAPNRPYLVASIDSGLTWQSWRYIDSTGYLVGNFIQAPMATPVAVGDMFYAAFPSYVFSQNIYSQQILAYSNNSGISLNYKTLLVGNNFPSNDSAKFAYKLVADPSDTNHLVFIYPYQPYGDADVMLTETYNAGTSWSTPTRVNDDTPGNGKMQDLVWADFDNDGDLIVSWRDRRNANGIGYATESEFYAAFRKKDSLNFSANFMLSDSLVAYNSILAQNGNDFMCIELTNDTLSAAWANTRDGSLDVWFIRVLANTGQVTSISLVESESEEINAFPNPSRGIVHIEAVDKSTIELISILDLSGKTIFSSAPMTVKTNINISDKKSGIYILKMFSNGKSFSKKIILN